LLFTTEIGKDISRAAVLLKDKEVIGIPTETVYGLAGNALDEVAVVKIFTVKDRPVYDPLIVHVAGIEQAKDLVEEWPSWAQRLAEKFWPGPLTLLLKKKSVISDLVTSGLPRVGIRVPQHPLSLALLQQLDFPLAAPSANPFGYISPTTAEHVMKQLSGKIPYILDGGNCSIGLESTIVGEDESGALVLYRPGGLSQQVLEEVCGCKLLIRQSSSRPEAPGLLLQHYAPRKKLLLYDESVAMQQGKEAGGIFFSEKKPGIPEENQLILSPTGDTREAASHLFAFLRAMDERSDLKIIFTAFVPETGLGYAINDRLSRAIQTSL
jgi:L-threonylcarbamoyladenylate synthase